MEKLIYITGDTHNNKDLENLSQQNMRLYCQEQGADFRDVTTVIVLGDFGLPWEKCPVDDEGIHPTNQKDKELLEWYCGKDFTVLALMGNHDNYDMIEKLPEVGMLGASVFKVARNVFYLKRGQVYSIEGKSFLVLGGAVCDDKALRTPHEDWWEQEEWTEGEKSACLSRILAAGGHFDYVLSHTGTTAGIAAANPYFRIEEHLPALHKDSNVLFNDKVDSLVSYKKWFFGHWHRDWGYDNYRESQYIPLFHKGIVL